MIHRLSQNARRKQVFHHLQAHDQGKGPIGPRQIVVDVPTTNIDVRKLAVGDFNAGLRRVHACHLVAKLRQQVGGRSVATADFKGPFVNLLLALENAPHNRPDVLADITGEFGPIIESRRIDFGVSGAGREEPLRLGFCPVGLCQERKGRAIKAVLWSRP